MSNTVIKNGIVRYFHCKRCIEEGKPSSIAVGWTRKGLQVWCENHESNLIALDFNGQQTIDDLNPESETRITDN